MKRLIILLMLLATLAHGQYVSGGGGVTQDQVDKSIADTPFHATWAVPTTRTATTAYMGGYYYFAGSAATFSSATTFGNVDNSYAAHFLVVIGATAADDITLTITGDSITDSSNVVENDSVTLSIPKDSAANDYFETPTKWLGQVSVIVTAGTPISCNYGYCKYWDNGNADFTVTGGESVWMGDITGATLDIQLIHHKATGWTYNAAAEPDPPTPLFSMVEAHGTNVVLTSNGYGCFKRAGGSFDINGDGSEGVIIRMVQSVAASIEYGQLSLRYTQ